MKNKKIKKICARVGAIMAAVLLVILMALPALAMISEENAQDLYWYLDIGETPNDPLHIILNSSAMVNDATYLDSALWYRGVFANGSDLDYVPVFPSINIYDSETVYWCIVYEDIAGGDVVDISYGNGNLQYNYSYVSGFGTYYTLTMLGSKSGTSSSVNNLRIVRNTDGTYSCQCTIDNIERTNDNANTRIRFAIVSVNAQPSAAFALFRRQPILTTEIEVYPQSVQLAATAGIGSVTQEQIENIRQEGYDNGFDAGYDEGYSDGNSNGYNEGLANTSLVDFVTALFRAPMEFIDSVLDFTIFGINFATAFRVLITMCIIAVVVVVVWKAVR